MGTNVRKELIITLFVQFPCRSSSSQKLVLYLVAQNDASQLWYVRVLSSSHPLYHFGETTSTVAT